MHELTRLSLHRPRTAALLLAGLTAMFAAGLPGLRTEFGFRVLLGDEHPSIQRVDRMIEQFGGGFPVLVAWECGEGLPCERALDEASLRMAHRVREELASAEHVRSVHGPSNAPLFVPADGGFDIRTLVVDGAPASDLDALAARAVSDPLWRGEIVSEDGQVGAIVVQGVDSRSETDVSVIREIERVLAPHQAQGFRFSLQGVPAAVVISGRELSESVARIIPVTILVIGLVVLLLCRSWQETLITLSTVLLALLWTFGLMGWLGWPQDAIHEVVAPLILVVGVCDAMHLLGRFRACPEEGSRAERLVHAAREVGTACVVTTLTTAGAFLAFTTSELDTFQRFGMVAAFGTLTCLLLTFTGLPLLAEVLPGNQARRSGTRLVDAIVGSAARIAETRSRSVLASGAALLACFGLGWVAHLEVGTSWDEFFGSKSTIRRWAHFLEARLGPTESLEVQLVLPPDERLESPRTLERVAAIQRRIEAIQGVGRTASIADRIALAHRQLRGDDPAQARAGDSATANAEILEILALGSPDDVARWINLDRSRLRISAPVETVSHAEDGRITGEAQTVVETGVAPGWSYSITGQAPLNADWVGEVQSTQLRSFPSAILIACLILAFHFRSPSLTLAALLPTLIAIVVTLGAMGWLGVSLDVGRAMIAAILIGIGVDDAVHVLTRYQHLRERATPVRRAIREAMHHSGPAIVATSAALSFGFLALIASAWETISSFGLFIALAIVGALTATLLYLPAIVIAFEGTATTRVPARKTPATDSLAARRIEGD